VERRHAGTNAITGANGLLVALAVSLFLTTVFAAFFNVAVMHVVSDRWRGEPSGMWI